MRNQDVLRVSVERIEDALLIRAAGELDMSSAAALSQELAAARKGSVTTLLDLSAVTFIDSTGLQLLLDASRPAADSDWFFFIVRPSESVKRLIELSRTADLLALGAPFAERTLV
jgi:anti-anti-sigma factor